MIVLDNCNIYDGVVINRCYKCNGLSHSNKSCVNISSCPRCAAQHSLKDYKTDDANLKCVNCLKNLTGWDIDNCLAYKNSIRKLKVDLSGVDDKQPLSHSTPAPSKITVTFLLLASYTFTGYYQNVG